MNIHELNLVRETYQNTMVDIINIISSYSEFIPEKMINDLENYHNEFKYQIVECIDGQSVNYIF